MKKPATDKTRIAFSNTLLTAKCSSTIKASENVDNEDDEFSENLGCATSASRYQSNPVKPMQQNPAYGVSQFTGNAENIYDNVK